ncbi:hypothetical protein [Mycolicibacterium arseniciresistens]|uniref:Uncharacterized protein n=1 Tax=Mycolicibacterium arseniciresistens TaxID=3062257 RepID=A0ABT8UN34_9MYCO|nr:hypothetical protein [Mycolicibacterium arseniciresistens]MDO3638561.1 hypothetical protein [Mycolicibacterium arseniciresistens]
MNGEFGFLTRDHAGLLVEIMSRRHPELADRIRTAHALSRPDAVEIVNTLSEEFVDHLDRDWEPTDYGRTVSEILSRVNAQQIAEWPD